MLFRVLSSFGFIVLAKDPSNLSVLEFTHVGVVGKCVSGISCCATVLNRDTIIDGNLEIFSSCVQGPPDPLKDSILAVLLYIKTSKN